MEKRVIECFDNTKSSSSVFAVQVDGKSSPAVSAFSLDSAFCHTISWLYPHVSNCIFEIICLFCLQLFSLLCFSRELMSFGMVKEHCLSNVFQHHPFYILNCSDFLFWQLCNFLLQITNFSLVETHILKAVIVFSISIHRLTSYVNPSFPWLIPSDTHCSYVNCSQKSLTGCH